MLFTVDITSVSLAISKAAVVTCVVEICALVVMSVVAVCGIVTMSKSSILPPKIGGGGGILGGTGSGLLFGMIGSIGGFGGGTLKIGGGILLTSTG